MKQPPLEEAKALIVKGQIDPAVQTLSEFLNGDFFNDEALFMLGACLAQKSLNGLSAVVTSAAIDARLAKGKIFPEALLNLGAAYKSERKNETALKIWLDALRHETLPKERSKILTNLATLYVNENEPERAIHYCDLALAEDPNNSGAKANRGLACLELGRWVEGWPGYRASYDTGDRRRRSYPGIPDWDGAPGKTVIVWGDQGIGDEIFFAECLADVQVRCKHVIFDCHPRMDAFFARSFPEMTVHGTRKNLSTLDWLDGSGAEAHIGLADLPEMFRRRNADWSGKPYLRAADALTGWGDARPGRSDSPNKANSPLRVGLSWTGGTKNTRADLRSMPIETLEPILRARPDVAWFSLQYTPDAAREVCELEEKTGIRISHYPGWVECFDYDRTASFVASLDLVITVTTAVHDLAGALGIPNWVMVPMRTGWRFQRGGDRLPWYGSSRLFRQQKDGDWSGPVDAIARKLANF